jgi:lipopolysaccharide transport system ATP-binding protein
MTEPILRTECLGKRYQIGGSRRHDTLRDAIASFAKHPRAWFDRSRNEKTFWALQDVSFSVEAGEIVGIIGRNGAGKSTLLKILSRITEPTTGRARVGGRVGSLLEVGTGFHSELTGRENIFLNGAILGMRRREIERKFDAIVDFAEVGRFLETPVKHYSSGMYVRLAFAVAAHLEAEILLVDEVLAVGDASFQRKCLNTLEQVGGSGRTVLFVSHHMSAVTRLCSRAILLEGGRVQCDGPAHEVASRYLRSSAGSTAERRWTGEGAPGNDVVRLAAIRVRREDATVGEAIDIRRPLSIEIDYEVRQAGHVLSPNLHFTNDEGILAFIAIDQDPAWRNRPRPVGRYRSVATIPANFLAEGTMLVGAAISTLDPVSVHVFEREAIAFHVVDTTEGDSARGDYGGPLPGVVRPLLPWTTSLPGWEYPGGSGEP